jgi:hypothetical protein
MDLEHLGEPYRDCKASIQWLIITTLGVEPITVSFVAVILVGNVQNVEMNWSNMKELSTYIPETLTTGPTFKRHFKFYTKHGLLRSRILFLRRLRGIPRTV